MDFRNQKALSVEQRIIGAEIGTISYKLFMEAKQKIKSFTVCDDPELKKFRIEDDDGVLSLKIGEILKNNSDAFHELVANAFVGKKRGDVAVTENQFFYWRIYSQYSYNTEEMFFVHKQDELYLYTDQTTETTLFNFISKYFGDLSNEDQAKLEELKLLKDTTHDDMQLRINEICEEINRSLQANVSFQKGAITFFDFLGWKGLWLNKEDIPLKEVSMLIERIREEFEMITREAMGHPNGFELSHLISISDTIALFTPHIPFLSKIEVLEIHARIGQFILQETVKLNYAIRGAITFGEYSFKNNVMIGPGIDECASWHEKCNWIGAHFTPQAQFILDREKYDENYIIEYSKIPMKSGYTKLKYCLNWSVDETAFDALLDSVKSMVPEISSKYIFTKEFIERDTKGGS